MATLVIYTCYSFIKLTPAFFFGALILDVYHFNWICKKVLIEITSTFEQFDLQINEKKLKVSS